MKTKKNMGIWMDHATADLIDVNSRENNCTIVSNFTASVKDEALSRSEDIIHNKEQQMHQAYYKEIAGEILKYDHVLLFGPTNAKSELHNYLKMDSHFKDISMYIESADMMSNHEKNAFAINYFEK